MKREDGESGSGRVSAEPELLSSLRQQILYHHNSHSSSPGRRSGTEPSERSCEPAAVELNTCCVCFKVREMMQLHHMNSQPRTRCCIKIWRFNMIGLIFNFDLSTAFEMFLVWWRSVFSHHYCSIIIDMCYRSVIWGCEATIRCYCLSNSIVSGWSYFIRSTWSLNEEEKKNELLRNRLHGRAVVLDLFLLKAHWAQLSTYFCPHEIWTSRIRNMK